MRLTVVVTVYNEAATVAEAIDQMLRLSVDKEVIVVDNCSTDGTRDVLERYRGVAGVQLVYQPRNLGFGTSVKTGIEKSRGEFIYIQYSDLEYDPACVLPMLDLAEKQHLDIVLGSRLFGRRDESVISVLKSRPYYAGSLIATGLVNRWYGRSLTDVIGAKLYRASAIRDIRIDTLGMGFDFEFISRICKRRLRVGELPVVYHPRSARDGKKIRAYHMLEALWVMAKVRLLG